MSPTPTKPMTKPLTRQQTKGDEAVVNIPTRYALIKRAEKILSEIDRYFEDATNFGLSMQEADPQNDLVNMRKGIIAMLQREGRLKPPAAPRDSRGKEE